MKSGIDIWHRRLLPEKGKWVIVALVLTIILVIVEFDIVQASCTNMFAVKNVRSLNSAYKNSSTDWMNSCLETSQNKKVLSTPWIRQYGVYLQEQKDTNSALSFWRSAVNGGSTDLLLMVYLGLAELETGQLELAANTLGNVAGAEHLLDKRGEQQLKHELYDTALNTYLVTTQVAPDSAKAWHDLGSVYYGLGDIQAAMTSYQIALTNDPNDHESHYELGMLFRELQEPEAAIAHLEQAVELTPETRGTGLRNILALVRSQRDSGSHSAALQTAQTAVDRFPQNAYAYYELGETLRLLDDTDGALTAFSKAIQLRSTNPEFYFASGLIYLQLSDLNKASQMFVESVTLSPQNKWYAYNYGLVLSELGHYCEAINYYQIALDIDSTYTLPKAKLDDLKALGFSSECINNN